MEDIDFRKIPKVALHDHLDGGVRPATLLALARSSGLALPSGSPTEVARAIADRANSGSLIGYLEPFAWTVAVMQTAPALERIAREAVEDLAADGVVLAELRFAPLLHTAGGLTAQGAIDAVVRGLRAGAQATGLHAGLILCAMRHRDEAATVVDLLESNWREDGLVIGLDLAGPENGHPVQNHPAIVDLDRRWPGAPITIHAGEAAGVESIWQALEAGAKRIGHGVRLIDDIKGDKGLVRVLKERGVLLEVCLSSNCQTGAATSLATHPLPEFLRLGLKVSIDVDNRLISATRYSAEMSMAHLAYELDVERILQIARDGVEASFMPARERTRASAAIEAWARASAA